MGWGLCQASVAAHLEPWHSWGPWRAWRANGWALWGSRVVRQNRSRRLGQNMEALRWAIWHG